MALQTLTYDTAQTALNAAIIFANDGGSPAGMLGNVLNPARNPQVLPSLQERWRYLQQRLISAGVDTFTKDVVLLALPPIGVNNPRAVSILAFSGYFNGVVWSGPNITAPAWSAAVTYTQQMTVTYNNAYWIALPNSITNLNMIPTDNPTFWSPFNNIGPALPADFVKPLEAWECIHGGNAWVPMGQAPDSLPTQSQISQRFGKWSFANDRMYLPPSNQTNDLKIKYLAMAPDIATLSSPLMVRGCATALALLLLDQLAGARGGSMVDTFKNRAEEAINQIINQTVRKQAYAQFVRRPFRSSRSRAGRSGL